MGEKNRHGRDRGPWEEAQVRKGRVQKGKLKEKVRGAQCARDRYIQICLPFIQFRFEGLYWGPCRAAKFAPAAGALAYSAALRLKGIFFERERGL